MLVETRGNDGIRAKSSLFCDAILNPSASFNGLWTLDNIPLIDIDDIINLTYSDLCKYVFRILFKDDFNNSSAYDLDFLINKAIKTYANFDKKDTPIDYELIDNNLYMQKLFLGPTRAFKDMAMQPFCDMLCNMANLHNKRYLILSATSGDTGPSTLQAIKDKNNIYSVCIYPHNATSDIQRLQMTTINSSNIKVFAIKGNFDDAQSALKDLINDPVFKDYLDSKDFNLSVSNSINFGRIVYQIIYHIHSYLHLLKNSFISNREYINIIVPSGNFGNALGAFFAKKMGININKILVVTNDNDVLCEFINNGIYDLRNRKLIHTNTPAMDILKSSNIERLLYHLFGSTYTKEFMESLDSKKYYCLSSTQRDILQTHFKAFKTNDIEVEKIIKVYAKRNIIIDPHTASGIKAFINKDIKTILCSTAEWSKFAPTISYAIDNNNINIKDIDALEYISNTYKIPINRSIIMLLNKEECNYTLIDCSEVKSSIIKWISEL